MSGFTMTTTDHPGATVEMRKGQVSDPILFIQLDCGPNFYTEWSGMPTFSSNWSEIAPYGTPDDTGQALTLDLSSATSLEPGTYGYYQSYTWYGDGSTFYFGYDYQILESCQDFLIVPTLDSTTFSIAADVTIVQ